MTLIRIDEPIACSNNLICTSMHQLDKAWSCDGAAAVALTGRVNAQAVGQTAQQLCGGGGRFVRGAGIAVQGAATSQALSAPLQDPHRILPRSPVAFRQLQRAACLTQCLPR